MMRGFVMLETLVALALVGLALFPLAAIVSQAEQSRRLTVLRLQVDQKMDEYQNRLLSFAPAHADLQPGLHAADELPLTVRWEVRPEQPDLVSVRLVLRLRSLCRVVRFYKSNLIEEVIHGERFRSR